ncbi:probable glycosyltransferase At5g03795 isoform X1 [Punica granatum]|uniref:Probable glycosyltransferase At5g03795 isoform X1 n=1 Tax=Punica granatum TaxID=22663 RepID=A0A6P8C270_PUNGR|nr:probable glycosyltransferase At5g03795 isoform X1 [Punica granatum]
MILRRQHCCSSCKLQPSSYNSFWFSSSLLILFLVLPLLFISLLSSTLGPERYSSLVIFSTWNSRTSFPSPSSASASAPTAPGPADLPGLMEAPLNYSDAVPSVPEFSVPLSENNNENRTIETPIEPEHTVKSYSRLERLEASLSRARSSIREAAVVRNPTSVHEDPDYVPRGPIYRNPNALHRSYLEMEKLFRIYVYREGEPPMFHYGPCRSIYSTEGLFISEMEKGNIYRTTDPDEALVCFLPFSVVMMVEYLYKHGSHEINAIGRAVVDYINIISIKHLFWNRSLGADHFMVSCHDWQGPRSSSYVPDLFKNSIRVLCNANTSEGFNPSKDASFPEIHLRTSKLSGLIGGLSPSRRTILAFFAGRLHGHIRSLLLSHWKDRNDSDVQVYEQVPKGMNYDLMMKKSRFCLCPSGYEVASPRVVEAIYAECVPVLISDGYIPPFSDVLNWKAFSVQVEVKDIPRIKEILMSISQGQYLRMQRRVRQVQRHFVLNSPTKRFDVFHMTVHSIWLRRLNIRIKG